MLDDPRAAADQVRIEELVLRLPGVAPGEAPELARAIAARVQERLRGTGRVGRIHLVEVHLRVPGDLARDELVERVAARIAEVAW